MPGADARPRLDQDPRPVVLLVGADDERSAHAYALTTSGFEVVAPRDAIEWCGRVVPSPDVIVADIRGPDGWRLVQTFKHHARMRDIPVVALVGDADAATRERVRRERCAAVCANACSGAALRDGLRAVLRYRSPVAG
jgi:CheY-like chemotaxis protein